MMNWQKITLPYYELSLPTVLRSGQAFRWRNINGIWSCALNNQIILLREGNENNQSLGQQVIEYTGVTFNDQKSTVDITKFINSYFNLGTSMFDLHKHWSKVDTNFPDYLIIKEEFTDVGLLTPPDSERATPDVSDSELPRGVRILAQDPWETLVSFIISSNNNIKRISQLCETLCIKYGTFIGELNGVPYFTFPQPKDFFQLNSNNAKVIEIPTSKLTKLETELRELGFGYRAKYITKTVQAMLENPDNFKRLYQPTTTWESDDECVQFLRQFDGVGPKVADCVALMGCNRTDLVPVDTHVWNVLKNTYRSDFNNWVDAIDDKTEENMVISKSNLKKSLGNKQVDVKIYPFVKRFFKEFWGLNSGWAQAVVFAGAVKLDNGINHVDDIEKLLIKAGKKMEKVESPKKRRKIK